MLVAIGHSAADERVLAEAAEAGAALSTHLGNALPHTLTEIPQPADGAAGRGPSRAPASSPMASMSRRPR